MDKIKIKAEERVEQGSAAVRRLRRAGFLLPAAAEGLGDLAPVAVQDGGGAHQGKDDLQPPAAEDGGEYRHGDGRRHRHEGPVPREGQDKYPQGHTDQEEAPVHEKENRSGEERGKKTPAFCDTMNR